MHRQIVYIGQIPQDTDQLYQSKHNMIGLGYALQAILGTGTLVDGLACTPTSPAGMTVNVAGGSIYALEEIDATAYGSVPADATDLIVKQGVVIPTTNFSCPAPATSGQSVVYLVEAIYQDVDDGSTVLPYYNASNPSVAWSGPNNTGVSQNTVRQGVCTLALKTGVAATTGTQATPSPDAGYTGLWAITVANGQSTITSGNIAQLSTAPFIGPKLPNVTAAVQAGAANYAADTSGTANTVAIALSPAVASLTTGMRVWVKVANTNTAGVVINTNGLGNVAAHRQDGSAIPAGALQAAGSYPFVYDGTYWQLQAPSGRYVLTANTTFYVATTGSDSNNGLTSGTPFLTIQHAVNVIANSIDLGGFIATISVANGTYTGTTAISGPFAGAGAVLIQGNTASPTSCIISTTSANCFYVTGGTVVSLAGFSLTTTTIGWGIFADRNSVVNITGSMNYAAVSGSTNSPSHITASDGARIIISANYTISGGAVYHWEAIRGGEIYASSIASIVVSGSPAFTAFAAANDGGVIYCPSDTFSGSSVTGVRYSATANGAIDTAGSGASYLPGNSAGTTGTGGQYI